jgi:heat shock protein HslJ
MPVGESVLAPPSAALVGPIWQWAETHYNDDSKAAPARPEAYAVTFAVDGMVNVRADCNQKGGTYTLEEKTLTIAITRSTMAMCPEGSLEDRFVRDLAGVAGWFLKDGDLYLDIKYDTGTMRLIRKPE